MPKVGSQQEQTNFEPGLYEKRTTLNTKKLRKEDESIRYHLSVQSVANPDAFASALAAL